MEMTSEKAGLVETITLHPVVKNIKFQTIPSTQVWCTCPAAIYFMFMHFPIIPNGPHELIPFYAYLEHTGDNLVGNVSQRSVKRRNKADDITFEIMTPGMQTNFFVVFPQVYLYAFLKIKSFEL
jgi:hypothetical protein